MISQTHPTDSLSPLSTTTHADTFSPSLSTCTSSSNHLSNNAPVLVMAFPLALNNLNHKSIEPLTHSTFPLTAARRQRSKPSSTPSASSSSSTTQCRKTLNKKRKLCDDDDDDDDDDDNDNDDDVHSSSSSSSQKNEDKSARRRRQNREAAASSRQRKKVFVNDLQQQLASAQLQLQQLQRDLTTTTQLLNNRTNERDEARHDNDVLKQQLNQLQRRFEQQPPQQQHLPQQQPVSEPGLSFPSSSSSSIVDHVAVDSSELDLDTDLFMSLPELPALPAAVSVSPAPTQPITHSSAFNPLSASSLATPASASSTTSSSSSSSRTRAVTMVGGPVFPLPTSLSLNGSVSSMDHASSIPASSLLTSSSLSSQQHDSFTNPQPAALGAPQRLVNNFPSTNHSLNHSHSSTMNANWELMGHALFQLFTLFQLQQQQQQQPMPTIPLIPLPQHHQLRHRQHRARPLQSTQMNQTTLQQHSTSPTITHNNSSTVSQSASTNERLAPDLVPPCPPPLTALFTLLCALLLSTATSRPSSTTDQARVSNLSHPSHRHTPIVRRRLVSPTRMTRKAQPTLQAPTPSTSTAMRRHQIGCFLRWWGRQSPVLARLRPSHQAYLVLFHIQMMAWLTSSLIRKLALQTQLPTVLHSISSSTFPTCRASSLNLMTMDPPTAHPSLLHLLSHKHVEMLE